MKNDIDMLLQQALAPSEEPNPWLKQKIMIQAREKERMEKRKIKWSLGTAVAIVRHDHIEIDVANVLIHKFFPKKETRLKAITVMNIFRYLSIAVLMALVTKFGFDYAMQLGVVNQISPGAKIPMIYVHLIVTVGYGLTVVHSIIRIIESIAYPKDIEV